MTAVEAGYRNGRCGIASTGFNHAVHPQDSKAPSHLLSFADALTYTAALCNMSVFRSWLPNRPLRTSYELPLWQNELEASTIPPPIVASRVLSPPRRSVSPRPSTDEMGVLRHKEKELQQTLQELLDAQAEGLMAGLGNAPADDVTSNGSLTPTISSVRSQTHSPAPIRRRKLGLRGARRALHRTILECSKLKEQEGRLIQSELDRDKEVLGQLNDWEDRRTGLQKEIARIEQKDVESRKRALQDQSSKLHNEIQELELRLSQMKNRHRQLLHEIATLDNAVQSQLSSYKSSLSLLDTTIKDFLARPPTNTTITTSQDPADDSTFLALPPKRRTLEMAKDHWAAHTASLAAQQAAAARDRAALDDGALVWRHVVEEVTGFERFLRAETGRAAAAAAASAGSARGKAKGERDERPAPEAVLRAMDGVITAVEAKMAVAVAKRWRLLEVCVGAELEALRQGRDGFAEAFGLADDGGLEKTVTDASVAAKERGLAGSKALVEQGGASQQKMYDTDDDGPDERIMFSRVKTNDAGL